MFSQLSIEDRAYCFDMACSWYEMNKSRDSIPELKRQFRQKMRQRCKGRGMNSIITMIIISIAVRLVVALILKFIEERYSNAPQEYLSTFPGYMEGVNAFTKAGRR